MMPNFRYVAPTSVDEVIRHLSTPGAQVHAGGTDLLGCLRDGVFGADLVVSLARVQGLRGIEQRPDGGLTLGALTPITQVASSPLVNERYPGLARAAAEVASPQLRNQGTLGGNLCQKPRCWYYRGDFHCLRKGGEQCLAVDGENAYHCIFGGDLCYIVHPSDTAPALAALEAEVKIAGPGGVRRVPVADFHVPPGVDPQRETVLEPGELLTQVLLPPPAPGLRSSYRKVRARRSWDFALAGAALALVFDGEVVSRARVYLSGAAPVPWRSRPVEEAITGTRLEDEVIARAREAVVEGAEPLEQNGYKLPLFQAVIAQELEAIRGA